MSSGLASTAIDPDMLDSAQAFLLRTIAADGPLSKWPACFELAVKAACLLVTRRGRLWDYFAAIMQALTPPVSLPERGYLASSGC